VRKRGREKDLGLGDKLRLHERGAGGEGARERKREGERETSDCAAS